MQAKLKVKRARKERIERDVIEQVRLGRLEANQKDEKIRDVTEAELFARRMLLGQVLAERFTRHLKFPAEAEVIELLLDAKASPDQVREICKDAFMTRTIQVEPGVYREVEVAAWPIIPGSILPSSLIDNAEQYISALNDTRFPSCDVEDRPSNLLKQLWFLSRALAGALLGVRTRTAINLVGSLRPEQVFQESRYAKPARKRKSKKYEMSR